jgi:hypothetical protein
VLAPADIAPPPPWQADLVRYSEFRELVDGVFGRLGRTLAADQVIGALGDRTANQALADGEAPAVVWRALCDAMEVPAAQRWGPEPRRRARER